MMKKFLQIVFCAVLLVSCVTEQKEIELSISVKSGSMEAKGGQMFVTVKSNASWTLSLTDDSTGEDVDWASLNVTSGEGDKNNVVLTLKANTAESASRTLRVTATADTVSAYATVQQAPAGKHDDNDPGQDPEPTPDPDPTPDPAPGKSGKYGWYELPVMNLKESGKYLVDANDSDLYYAYHLCAGNEKGPGGKKARNYTVCYSAEHHCPVWVAAPRHSMYESGASRTDAYAKDPDIPSSIQYDSKETGGGCNKGHMLGSAERLSTTATNKQVFYYTNIAPQYSDTFNTGGGGWNTLEDWVDGQVCSDTLYVVIGTYFEKYTDRRGYTDSPKTISFGGRNDVTRPSMFYYVLLRTKSGKSGKPLSQCSASEIKCAAFVRSHVTPKGVKVSEKDMMSVSDLEKLTGFTFFPNVPQAPKDSYKASEWGL